MIHNASHALILILRNYLSLLKIKMSSVLKCGSGFTFSIILFVKMAVVSGSGELGNCMYAVNAACEIVTSNNRDCKVTCETPQRIGKLFEELMDTLWREVYYWKSPIYLSFYQVTGDWCGTSFWVFHDKIPFTF